MSKPKFNNEDQKIYYDRKNVSGMYILCYKWQNVILISFAVGSLF